jgi:hypothetical protein
MVAHSEVIVGPDLPGQYMGTQYVGNWRRPTGVLGTLTSGAQCPP